MSKDENAISKQQENLDSILNLVSNLQFDESKIAGQIVDEAVVKWYTSRFDMFVEDGVLSAIQCYLNKLQNDDVNEITKLSVMHEALNRQLDK